MPDVDLCAQLACIWEVTARKPGNVTRFDDFEDVTYLDFLASAAAITPVMASASLHGVGATVLEGVRATRRLVRSNTNLGIILLLAPLSAVPKGVTIQEGVEPVLAHLTLEDARQVYAAIRLAMPGGLGEAPEQDVRAEPTLPLRQVMTLAAERDLVARQYAHGYAEVLGAGVPALLTGLRESGALEAAILFTHLSLMAKYPDTLIARKRGLDEAREASARAQEVLEQDWPGDGRGKRWQDLDRWLRAAGHQRNPGATADLVTACLFTALREGNIPLPSPYPWSRASTF
jgi:triphosphoribosyl-dephospho-CoA synthase